MLKINNTKYFNLIKNMQQDHILFVAFDKFCTLNINSKIKFQN